MQTRVFIVALLLGWSGLSEAQSSLRLPSVRYEAPASCPSREFFLERLRARLLADRVRALTSLKLTVELRPGPSSVRGSVQIERASGRSRRSLEGPTCREVVEGLALIAALAVTTGSPESKSARATKPSTPVPAPKPSDAEAASAARPDGPFAPASPNDAGSTAKSRSAAAAPVIPQRDPTGPSAPTAESTAPPPVPDRSGSEPVRPAPTPPPTAAIDPSEDVPSTPSLLPTWSLGLSVLALHGIAPELLPGLQLQAALTLHSSLDWTFRAAGRVALPRSFRSEDGIADFAFAAGVVQVCAGGGLGSSGLALEACAIAEPGWLRAAGKQTENPETCERPWLGVGGGAGVGWRAARWLALRAGAEVLVPSRRDSMILAETVVHRVPAVCLRLQLALEVPIE